MRIKGKKEKEKKLFHYIRFVQYKPRHIFSKLNDENLTQMHYRLNDVTILSCNDKVN